MTDWLRPNPFGVSDPRPAPYVERDLKEMRELLDAAGYNPALAVKLLDEGMGPGELKHRLTSAPYGWGSLTYTHGFAQVSTPLRVIKSELLEAQQEGEPYYFFTLDAQEALLKPQSLHEKKIRSLTMGDVRRLAVR